MRVAGHQPQLENASLILRRAVEVEPINVIDHDGRVAIC